MRIGYFCTAGYTETGGIQQFLEKIRSDIEWERCFPAVEKPAPKLRRLFPEPRQEDSGATGQSLVARMLQRLARFHSGVDCRLDVVLLIDDADCRFKQPAGSFTQWVTACRDEVRKATQKDSIEFIALLASPEIESWLLTDWEAGFGHEYPDIEQTLLKHLEKHLLGERPWVTIEDYGGQLKRGTCEHKLSENVQQAFSDLLATAPEGTVDAEICVYSKKLHGPRMLRRIRPEELLQNCTQYFATAYTQLLALVAPATNQPSKAAPTRQRKKETPAPGRRMRPKLK